MGSRLGRRRLTAACVLAAAAAAAAPAAAAVRKAEVQGVADRALAAELVRAVGEDRTAPATRLEARRRAREAAESATALLRSEGYYDSAVAPDVAAGETPRAVIRVTPGPRTTVASAVVDYAGAAPDAAARAAALSALKLPTGTPGRAADLIAAEGRAVAALAQAGYADAAARPRTIVVDHAAHAVEATYVIAAGGKVRLDGLKISSTGRTDPRWVRRLRPWREGAVYKPSEVAELERRLTDTQVYDTVAVALAPPSQATPDGLRPVVVSLADRRRRAFDLSAGYSTSEGADFDVRYLLFNQLRRGDTLTLEARLAELDTRFGGEAALPDFLRPGQTLTPSAYLFHTVTNAYDETGGVVGVDLTQRYGKTSYVTRGVSFTDSRVADKELGGVNLQALRLIGAFYFDRTDDALDPRHGYKADARAVPTFITGDENRIYVRLLAQASAYLPLTRSGGRRDRRARPGGLDRRARSRSPSTRRRRRARPPVRPGRARAGPLLRGRRRLGAGIRLPGRRAVLSGRHAPRRPLAGGDLHRAASPLRQLAPGRRGVHRRRVGGRQRRAEPEPLRDRGGDRRALQPGLRADPRRLRHPAAAPDQLQPAAVSDLPVGRAELLSEVATQPPEAGETAAPPPPPKPRARRRLGRGVAALLAGLALLLAGALALVRFGADTGPGRAAIVRMADGLRLGPVGRLRVEGLSGDVFGRFALRRLAIIDARGPWLEARDIELAWRPLELLHRRVHATRLRVGDLIVSRPPQMERRPKGPQREGPVSMAVDDLAGRIETRPALSRVPGDWDVRGRFDYSRAGRADGRIAADSRLHAGDGAKLAFVFGDSRLHLDGTAFEARGGALAGALGLPSDQRFVVQARADGDDAGGVFHLDARSGDAQPASAEGRWTPEGGRLDAQLKLGASRLTQGFAQRIGPQVRLRLTGRRLADGRYLVRAQADGASARATAVGPVDVKARTTPGLAVTASVDRFGDWVHAVDLGPVRVAGELTGGLDRFTLKGRLSGEHLQQKGYTLAHAEGPAELSRDGRGWRWSGALTSSGGGGSSGLAPLLGARPTLQTTGEVLPDRRWLIEELHLAGANLRLDGSGGATLFGGVAFKGRLQLPSVAGVHPGSHGALDAGWSAESDKGSHAWRYSVQAQGRGLATGLPEADRLLGPAPRLDARGVYDDGVTQVAAADLSGVKLHAVAKGRYARDGALDFGLDWTAQGRSPPGRWRWRGR